MNPTTAESEQCAGVFNFMTTTTESSLLRNGRVMIDRDPNGNTAESKGIDLQEHTMQVVNARKLSTPPTCERNGFELVSYPLQDDGLEFTSHQDVVDRYYSHCAKLVEQATGARAYAFDHNVRSAGGKQSGQRIEGGQEVQGPAHVVHGDYTLRAAPERVLQLAEPPSGNDTLRGTLAEDESLISSDDAKSVLAEGGRFAIINVWRNIAAEPVATHPLALCDGQTVLPEDLVVFEIHYPNRIGENYFAKHSDRHKMYFFPQMTRDEVLLIKQWDTAGELAQSNGARADAEVDAAPCTFSFHSAFEDPQTPDDAADRWSIEVRCLVIYD